MARTQTTENRSEQGFLSDQAANAGTAMLQTVQEMKQTMAQAADLRTCLRHHPWIATGSIVAAGFVAGAVVSRSRSTSGKRRRSGTNAEALPESTEREPARAKTGFVRATLGTILSGLGQTLLQRFIVAAVAGTNREPVTEEPLMPCGPSPPVTAEQATP
ncbi:MAG: hypothetical protein HY290_15775 [Planctomycetia bacterium]|nr:hypothetical protein [Planctomycetia bacterium]